MHKAVINPDVVSRVTERRGRLRVFDSVIPGRTAHIVVDLQNGFMAPGQVAEIGAARDIVPNVNRISEAVRRAGGLVVYIQNTFDDIAVRTWSTYFDHFCTPERRARMIAAFIPEPRDTRCGPGSTCGRADLQVRNVGSAPSRPAPRTCTRSCGERGIDTLIITGTASQVCCELTARDAMMLNYKVFFVADGNATFTDEEHNATLSAMAHTFCDVVDADTLVSLIGQSAAARHAA